MSSLQIPCPECGRELKLRDRSLLGRKGKCPKCGHSFILQEPEEVELELADDSVPAPGVAAQWVPDSVGQHTPSPTPSVSSFPAAVAEPAIPLLNVPTTSVSHLARQRRKSPFGAILLGLALVVLGGGGVWLAMQPAPPIKTGSASAPAAPAAPAAEVAVAAPAEITASPTKGSPIDLKMIPFGARVVINLRPAELWTPSGWLQEFRLCLGPLGEYLAGQLKTLTGREPTQIEEVLFCLIPNERETPPDLCMVVHLKEPSKRSDLLEQLGGQRTEEYGQPVYVAGERAWLILDDNQTLAMCPTKVAREMVDAMSRMHPAAAGIGELLPMTDRSRLVTVVGDVMQTRIDAKFLAPGKLTPLLEQALDWVGENVETVAWSLHQAEDVFYSQVLLRNQTMLSPKKLEATVQEQLKGLPKQLAETFVLMQPREAGKRQLIGRVPAMAQVVAMATQLSSGPRYVQLLTALPAKAGPNLALGTLLAWDESTRTDFSRTAAPAPVATTRQLPEKIADRLKLKMDVDFRRTPLQEVIAFIADEIKTEFRVEGDALKAAGYTQNMPSTFKLDQVTPKTVVLEIAKFNNAGELRISVDEEKKRVILATRQFFADKGMTEFPLEP